VCNKFYYQIWHGKYLKKFSGCVNSWLIDLWKWIAWDFLHNWFGLVLHRHSFLHITQLLANPCPEKIDARVLICTCALVSNEWLLWIIWKCTCDLRYVFLKYKFPCCWTISYVSYRMKQDEVELWKKGWLSLVLQLLQQSSYLGCAIALLKVMVAQAAIHSCWGFCTCGQAYVWSYVSQGMVCLAHFQLSIYMECTIGEPLDWLLAQYWKSPRPE